MDDTKILHKDSTVVDYVIHKIERKVGKMTITQGNRHTFVRVNVEFMKDGTVSLPMDKYVDECIKLYKDKIKNKAAMSAKGDSFDKDDGDKAVHL